MPFYGIKNSINGFNLIGNYCAENLLHITQFAINFTGANDLLARKRCKPSKLVIFQHLIRFCFIDRKKVSQFRADFEKSAFLMELNNATESFF
jgi:hypothetical protein